MQRAIVLAAAAALAVPACRLDPLVDDTAGASVNLKPSDAVIPDIRTNSELATQISLNDSLDSKALGTESVIPHGTGIAGNGTPVSFWAFGQADRAPSPIYFFGADDPATAAVEGDHLPLVETVPGDDEYNPIRAIYRVAVTDKYHGEKITTLAALHDAIEIGLVEAPVATKTFINWPVVRPGTRLSLSATESAPPVRVYAHGYSVESYRLGGDLAVQPNPNGLLPTAQVSFLRGPRDPAYNAARPIFQASPPTATTTYTPLSIVVNVDVSVDPMSITRDSDLFMRSATGAITATTSEVIAFTVTTVQLDLQQLFPGSAP